MDVSDIGIIIIIIIAYFPVIYTLQKRMRRLEDEVNELKNRIK